MRWPPTQKHQHTGPLSGPRSRRGLQQLAKTEPGRQAAKPEHGTSRTAVIASRCHLPGLHADFPIQSMIQQKLFRIQQAPEQIFQTCGRSFSLQQMLQRTLPFTVSRLATIRSQPGLSDQFVQTVFVNS